HSEDPGILVGSKACGPNRFWHGVQELADAVFRTELILPQDPVDPLRRGQFHEMVQILSVSRTLLAAYVGLPALLIPGLLGLALLAGPGRLGHLIPQLCDLHVPRRNLLVQLLLGGPPLRYCLGTRDPTAIGGVIEHGVL